MFIVRVTVAQTKCYKQVILHSKMIHKSIYWHMYINLLQGLSEFHMIHFLWLVLNSE